MAIVTNTLLNTLVQHVQNSGTVVWYDPQNAYSDVASTLTPDVVSGAVVHRYRPERGFLALRRELEASWKGDQPPKLVIYVRLARSECRNALVEYEVAGVVLRPGQLAPDQNTSLAFIARQALPQVFPAAKVEELVAQVEAGQLSLGELDELAAKGLEGQSGVIVTLFGTGNAPEAALRFLSDSDIDKSVEERNAAASLAALLSQALGVPFSAAEGLPALRRRVARQILMTDFIGSLGGDIPQSLSTYALAEQPAARQAAVNLAQQWRNRLDCAESYCLLSASVARDIGVENMTIPLNALARCQTFRAAEVLLQTAIEEALRKKPTGRLVEFVSSRLEGFWSGQDPLLKTRWEVILAAGRVLLATAGIDNALKAKGWSAESLVARYAFGEADEEPWCGLDLAQRHLERDFHRFELDPQQHKSLLQLVSQARRRYADTSSTLASHFCRAYAEAKFELAQLIHQTDIFSGAAASAADDSRWAYILVDALRYEMARELVGVLDSEWDAQLVPALAVPPTITEVGMAALMPGADRGMTIATLAGKLTPLVDGQALRTRQDRVTHFEKAAAAKSVTVKLEQLAPLTSRHLAQQLADSQIILVTATEEIDGLCETNPALARRMLDDVLNQLRRGIKTLFAQGVDRAVVTADHGYLFGDEIFPGQTIDPPGGETVSLKRRVWVGKGGASIPGTLRQPLSAFGIGGDLELVTPQNLAIFKVPGGSVSYFHGGLSLPELVIPLLTISSAAAQSKEVGARIAWTLTLGSPAITTRFLSVTVAGKSMELLPAEPPAVSVEVRAGDQTISVPISATYGFQEATRDVQLKAVPEDPLQIASNTITLQITDLAAVTTLTVHLLDADTGISLQRIEKVPFEISL